MEQTDLSALRERVEAELKKRSGVIGVGFGFKEVNGEITEQIGFRVYVREKRPVEALAPGEVIPDEIEGFPTDVITVDDEVPLHSEDIETHDPLIGGISITSFRSSTKGVGIGTLGFFATINGVAGPKNVVLVSNHHVIAADSAALGDTIYQPRLVTQPDDTTLFDTAPESRNPIAEIDNLGKAGSHPFAYPAEGSFPYYVDCATAKLNISISSWCNTNCGVSYKNEIRALAIGTSSTSSKLADIGRISEQDVLNAGAAGVTVYKVGRQTSRTQGKVIDPQATRSDGSRIIVIHPVQPAVFADESDSGSALIDGQRRLVGIVYAKEQGNPLKIRACHILPVLDYLKVTAITEANPPVAPAGHARADLPGGFVDGINEAIPLRERLRATRRGAELYAKALEHRDEVVTLVNRCRPVTVAWHRGKGPAFLNRAIANVRNPDERIPHQIDGVSRAALLERMRDVLRLHGSDSLRGAIDLYEEQVLSLVDTFDDLRELADRFEREARAEEEVPCGAG